MKLKKIVLSMILLGSLTFTLSANENLSFSTTTDFAYYPKSDYIAGKSHFAPITGAFSAVEARITGNLDYTIPTPLGKHWLVSGATLNLGTSLELSPLSIKPGINASFTPLPFLVFSAGAEIGTAWSVIGLQGMALSDGISAYENLPAFQDYYTRYWAQGVFQFDTGAVWAGDWNHVQIQYTYRAYYDGIIGLDKGDIWMWQATGNKANGLKNYQCLILAYQMPLMISRAGIMFEFEGHYGKENYGPLCNGYNGNFKEISIVPMAQFSFTKNDTLSVILGFSSRRSFVQEHEDSFYEPYLTFAGREWYFKRIAFSYTHRFF